VEAVHSWLRNDWALEMHVFRILPTERSSSAALERLNLTKTELVLPGEERPYLWYHAAGASDTPEQRVRTEPGCSDGRRPT
jgi:hypothetical protein